MAVIANNAPRPAATIPTTATAVTGAIRKAAQATGTSFDYLLATAKVESDLNPSLTMRNSSATGLFQFLEQTWLETMKQAGKQLGFGKYADAITQTKSGRLVVQDPALRSEMMTLRKDATANAVMGAAYTQQNAAYVAKRIGRQPTDGELYIAHFFGPYTGAKFIGLADSKPQANAAAMYPAAARANRPIFYDKQGGARSVAGVYAELVRRYQVARASPTPGLAPNVAVAETAPAAPAAAATDTAAITSAFADASASPSSGVLPIVPGEPGMFHSLFQTAERHQGVSPIVSELWGGQAARERAQAAQALVPPASPDAIGSAPNAGGAALDLFQETLPNVRGLFKGSV